MDEVQDEVNRNSQEVITKLKVLTSRFKFESGTFNDGIDEGPDGAEGSSNGDASECSSYMLSGIPQRYVRVRGHEWEP